MPEPDSDAEGETITTNELLERSARAALELQREDGSFPPGQNGIYDEKETPVRTTSHWLMVLSKVYEITNKKEFADAANNAADYLISTETRPYGSTFHSRSVKGKDMCDGLIGQSRPIRSLAYSGQILQRKKLIKISSEVFSEIPFDRQLGLWKKVEIDGRVASFDRTLNHQILFASAAAELIDHHSPASAEINIFLDNLEENMSYYSDGIIKHYFYSSWIRTISTFLSNRYDKNVLLNKLTMAAPIISDRTKDKEIGYHIVNMRGLAQLKKRFPHHKIWNDGYLEPTIEAISVKNHMHLLQSKNTDFGSTMPEIDYAVAATEFIEGQQTVQKLINCAFSKYDELVIDNSRQPAIPPSAKVYNLVYIPNTSVEVSNDDCSMEIKDSPSKRDK